MSIKEEPFDEKLAVDKAGATSDVDDATSGGEKAKEKTAEGEAKLAGMGSITAETKAGVDGTDEDKKAGRIQGETATTGKELSPEIKHESGGSTVDVVILDD